MFLGVVLVNYDDSGDTKVVLIQNVRNSVLHSNKDWDLYCQELSCPLYLCLPEVLALFERPTEIEVVVHS